MATSSQRVEFPPSEQAARLLSGYTYRPEVGPCWQVDDLATSPATRYIFPVRNQPLSLQSLSVRYCTGTYDVATQRYVPCPHQRLVQPPYQNCYPCFEAIGFNPAFYNVPRAQVSPRQQAYNQEPHCTYLAYFGPEVVKVGIAHHKRVLKRWLEQGARAALTLQTTADAYAARALEVQVSQALKLPERITGNKKKQLLNLPYCFEQAAQTLTQYQQVISQALSLQENTYTVQDLQPHYLPKVPPQPLADADRQQQAVAGRVLGMVGDLVVYEAEGRFWMSALKQYVGRARVDFSITKRVAPQGQLPLL